MLFPIPSRRLFPLTTARIYTKLYTTSTYSATCLLGLHAECGGVVSCSGPRVVRVRNECMRRKRSHTHAAMPDDCVGAGVAVRCSAGITKSPSRSATEERAAPPCKIPKNK